jgi:hypothetical protein
MSNIYVFNKFGPYGWGRGRFELATYEAWPLADCAFPWGEYIPRSWIQNILSMIFFFFFNIYIKIYVHTNACMYACK